MAKIWDNELDDETENYTVVTNTGSDLKNKIRDAKSKGFGPVLKNTVGICADCDNFRYALNNMHQVVVSYCTIYSRNMLIKIESCSEFKPKGQMSLSDMYELATLIEVGKEGKIVKGFT